MIRILWLGCAVLNYERRAGSHHQPHLSLRLGVPVSAGHKARTPKLGEAAAGLGSHRNPALVGQFALIEGDQSDPKDGPEFPEHVHIRAPMKGGRAFLAGDKPRIGCDLVVPVDFR